MKTVTGLSGWVERYFPSLSKREPEGTWMSAMKGQSLGSPSPYDCLKTAAGAVKKCEGQSRSAVQAAERSAKQRTVHGVLSSRLGAVDGVLGELLRFVVLEVLRQRLDVGEPRDVLGVGDIEPDLRSVADAACKVARDGAVSETAIPEQRMQRQRRYGPPVSLPCLVWTMTRSDLARASCSPTNSSGESVV